jgi:DNA segregation ATPase FtsK/SpoIIIE-like protein
MIEFPRMVYISPGMSTTRGGTFDYTVANDEEGLAHLLASGWFETIAEALAGEREEPEVEDVPEPEAEPEPEPVVEAVEEEAAPVEAVEPEPEPELEPDYNIEPTREELEMKATELGLQFDGRTSDNKLRQRIEDHLDRMEAEAREG